MMRSMLNLCEKMGNSFKIEITEFEKHIKILASQRGFSENPGFYAFWVFVLVFSLVSVSVFGYFSVFVGVENVFGSICWVSYYFWHCISAVYCESFGFAILLVGVLPLHI